LLLLLGVCTTLDPEMNPTAVIEPYLARFLLGEKKEWSEMVVEASREMALAALSLPAELQRFMDRALRGEIEVGVRNLDENARVLYFAGQQLLWGLLTVAGAALATVWEGRGHPRLAWGAVIAAGLAAVLLVLAWFGGRPRRSRSRR
jgi:predicted unusual protein kinase regulating ubiquinone biosynthesis (AarF/ABC1/UbiB family)